MNYHFTTSGPLRPLSVELPSAPRVSDDLLFVRSVAGDNGTREFEVSILGPRRGIRGTVTLTRDQLRDIAHFVKDTDRYYSEEG